MKILPMVCVLTIAALAVPAPAQVAASISGKVEDASSAAVRQATVTVKSLETGATRVLRYRPIPGRYRGCIPYIKGQTSWAE